MPSRRHPSTDTRDRILRAARRLFASPSGARHGTLADLARVAGVSRATVHRHFKSREDLLRAIDVEPEPGARDRALAAGLELLARDGLARLSMDEVAERAAVSRANLYRLFPGKSALFTALIQEFSPLEPVGETARELADQPPEAMMPALARAIARRLEGRTGIVRSLFLEAAGPSGEAAAARDFAIRGAILPVVAYVSAQMAAGRLRPMHPLLAVQSFAGPIVFHLLTRQWAEELLGFDAPLEQTAVDLAQAWLRGALKAPEEG